MKKIVAFILAVVLVACVAVPAAAKDVLNASVKSSLPALAENNENVRLHEQKNMQDLSEEKQQAMKDGEKALQDVDTKGLALKYYLNTEILSEEESVSLAFEPIPHNEILFMQYINGMWVTLEHSIGKDRIITIPEDVDAPFAIFVDPLPSPGAKWTKLVPILTDESTLIVQLHTLEEVVTLSEEIQNRMAEAKERLAEACPAGFAVKYFFEMEVLGTEGAVDVDFEPIAHDEIVFMQFVNGAWVELESSTDSNGIITVCGLQDGPVATFIK